MLACARIGAIHNVVFGGFSAAAVVERMQVSEAKALITADATMRRGEPVPIGVPPHEPVYQASVSPEPPVAVRVIEPGGVVAQNAGTLGAALAGATGEG